MNQNRIAFGILALGIFFSWYIIFEGQKTVISQRENAVVTDGKQIIEITAKGGYSPERTIAKASVPTVLRVVTNGTFDCSASFRIPDMNIAKMLPQTGTTDFDLGVPKAGILHGSCGMGMYPFEIDFE